MKPPAPRPGRPVRPLTAGFVCLGVVIALLLAACGGPSEEERLVERFRSLAALAEGEDTAGIMEILSDDYGDFEGRDKAATEDMIRGYFESYRGIVLHVLGVRVADLGDDAASLEADVTLSSGAVEALRRLVKIAGRYYRIDVRWIKRDGAWLVDYAEWREIELGDLLSESRDKLQDIL
jgi:hypothetical protein